MTLRTDQLDFELDPSLIARHPVSPRDTAKLMVVHLQDGRIEHRQVADIHEYLGSGDQLVLNDTRVVPARFRALRVDTGGRLEGLLLDAIDARSWWAMIRKSRRLQPGHRLELLDHKEQASGEFLEVEDSGEGRIRVRLMGTDSPETVFAKLGLVPLPPYILNARRDAGEAVDDQRDSDWYQTVYASINGPTRSVAAPTAGLHFTSELIEKIQHGGTGTLRVSLEVGAGTFKPIDSEFLSEHPMHRERCVVDSAVIDSLRALESERANGNARVIPVGTTAVRTLESLPHPLPAAGSFGEALEFDTQLLIEPGYAFRHLDGLLTNFHLPRSTLLALVAAVTGIDELHELYQEAISRRYRFFSYGDAMLLLR